jgi:hypothetical protein
VIGVSLKWIQNLFINGVILKSVMNYKLVGVTGTEPASLLEANVPQRHLYRLVANWG